MASWQTSARDRAFDVLKGGIEGMDRLYTASSKVGNPAFFDAEVFPWVGELEANWTVIRKELDGVMAYRDELPNFQDISPEQASLSKDNGWKTYFFYAYGVKAGTIERCPKTAELLHKIPGMTTAFFSILGPHKHLPPHRGPYKGVIRYHLGLKIPEPASACGIRVGDETRHWEEGKSLIFDDTYDHEAWNDTGEDRVVLFVDFIRPMRLSAATLNRGVIKAIGLSPFVLGSKGNYTAWEKRFEDVVNKP